MNIEELKVHCDKDPLYIDMTKENGGFKFGPRWRNIGKICTNGNEVLTTIKIDPAFIEDIAQFSAHPAMLDNAANIATEVRAQTTTNDMFLPFTYNSLKLYKSLPESFYSYQVVKTDINENTNVVNLDVYLIDADGEVLAKIEKYSIKRVNRDEIQKSQGLPLYNEVILQESSLKETVAKETVNNVLIISSGSEQEKKIETFYQEKAKRAVVAYVSESFVQDSIDSYKINGSEADFGKLFDAINLSGFNMVVYAAGIQDTECMKSYETFQDAKKAGVLGFYNMLKALSSGKNGVKLKFAVLSNNVKKAAKDSEVTNPLGAAIFGLAQVASNEFKKNVFRCFDIDEKTDLAILHKDIMSDITDKDIVIYRNNVRYIEVLREYREEQAKEDKVPVREDGVYVITGGITGIASVVGKMLTKQAKVKLAFISRSGIPQKYTWESIIKENKEEGLIQKINVLKELEDNGAKVSCYACDVSDYDRMKQVFETIRSEQGNIYGVFHGAGLPGNALIMNKTVDEFNQVVKPKIDGAWIINDITKNDSIDFMLVFSSILSRYTPMGQSDYAAANAFLNSFSTYRRGIGKRTTSLEWSVWDETGMALQFAVDELRGPFYCVSNSDGEKALSLALDREVEDILVGSIDLERVAQYGGEMGFPVDNELKKRFKKLGSKRTENRREIKEVKIISKEEITDTERVVASIWGMVLGSDEVNVTDNFYDLGGDSIIATELVKAINGEFSEVLDISDVFTYTNVKSISAYIDNSLGRTGAEQETEEEKKYTVEEIMQMIEEGKLSVEDADELLQKIQN